MLLTFQPLIQNSIELTFYFKYISSFYFEFCNPKCSIKLQQNITMIIVIFIMTRRTTLRENIFKTHYICFFKLFQTGFHIHTHKHTDIFLSLFPSRLIFFFFKIHSDSEEIFQFSVSSDSSYI